RRFLRPARPPAAPESLRLRVVVRLDHRPGGARPGRVTVAARHRAGRLRAASIGRGGSAAGPLCPLLAVAAGPVAAAKGGPPEAARLGVRRARAGGVAVLPRTPGLAADVQRRPPGLAGAPGRPAAALAAGPAAGADDLRRA